MKSARSITARFAVFCTPLALLACADAGRIIDNWGPPSGYTLLTGSVRKATGVPAQGAEVSLYQCTAPVGGYLGSAVTDSNGHYRLLGSLPPIGLSTAQVDSLQVQCAVSVNRAAAPIAPIVLRFSPDSLAAPRQTLDLNVP